MHVLNGTDVYVTQDYDVKNVEIVEGEMFLVRRALGMAPRGRRGCPDRLLRYARCRKSEAG